MSLKAGEFLSEQFYRAREVSMKGSIYFVPNVDHGSGSLILAELSRDYPHTSLLGEESAGARADEGFVWIVDPVDGTRNCAWGIPFVSLVVGLALDGELIVGVNYDPMSNEVFHAERGKWGFLNDNPIHVSERPSLSESVIGIGFSYAGDDEASNGLRVLQSLPGGIRSARVIESSALGISYAAAGRYDIYFNHRFEPWDQVAGVLLVEKAGGVVTNRMAKRAGLYSDGIIASSAPVHAEFMGRTDGLAWRNPTHRTV